MEREIRDAKASPKCRSLLAVLAFLVPMLTSCTPEPSRIIEHNLVEATNWLPKSPEGLVADPKSDLIGLPIGESLEFPLSLPRHSQLSFAALASREANHPTLHVGILWDEETHLTSLADLHPGRQVTVALNGTRSGLALVTLEARAPATKGLLLLRRPRLLTPAQEPSEETADAKRPDGSRPNLIVYMADTLRADHLGVYGYGPRLSPRLDEFAATATVFEDAVAQSPWTRASVASIFTGLEPNLHAVNDRHDSLTTSATTLAELLAEHGYHTAAFITNGNAGEKFGLDQGFDHWWRPKGKYENDSKVVHEVLRYLSAKDLDQPFFLWIHTLDPHGPYLPQDPFRSEHVREGVDLALGELSSLKELKKNLRGERRPSQEHQLVQDVISLYDAEVAYADHVFGQMLDGLRERSLYDGSVIVVLSDHGEELWDHGSWSHGHTLHRELLHIPLILKAPKQRTAQRSSRLAQQIDILPTLLDYAGVAAPAYTRGISLRQPAAPGRDHAFSVLDLDGRHALSVTTPNWKMILPYSKSEKRRLPLLFARPADPFELRDMSHERPVVVAYLETLLNRHEAAEEILQRSSADIDDPELVRELRALGYLD